MNIMATILFLALGIWQFYITYKNFQLFRLRGAAGSSPFMLLALLFSAIFGCVMIALAIINILR